MLLNGGSLLSSVVGGGSGLVGSAGKPAGGVLSAMVLGVGGRASGNGSNASGNDGSVTGRREEAMPPHLDPRPHSDLNGSVGWSPPPLQRGQVSLPHLD